MATTAIALVAACVALGVVGLILVAGRRARRDSEHRIMQALGEMGRQMDALSGELTRTIEQVREDSRRAQVLFELGRSLDLDEVLSRTVEAAGGLGETDAAIVHATAPDGSPIVASIGVPLEAAESQAVSGSPDGTPVRAVALSYHFRPGEVPERPIRSGIAVPLQANGTALGFLAVYSRSMEAPFGPDAFEMLEAIAERAGPAIENARRFQEARRQSGLDLLTGLQSRLTFHEVLAREIARAHRHGHGLAVCVLDLDDFKAVNDAAGHLGGDAILTEFAGHVRAATRPVDVAFRIGGDEFAVILPEARRSDAEGLFARVQAMLSRTPPQQAPRMRVSGGIAELQHDDDALQLFERAEAALGRAKASGKGTAR